jgi:arginyl-tRNA synthetase
MSQERNRLDIALLVHRVVPSLTVEQIYPGILYGIKGVDFTVAMARFRLQGKPDEWAKKVVESVCDSSPVSVDIR